MKALQARRVWKPHPQVIFSAALVAIFAWAVLEAQSWPLRTRFFPMIVGVSMLALALVQLGRDLLRRVPAGGAGAAARPDRGKTPEGPSQGQTGTQPAEVADVAGTEAVLARVSLRETAVAAAQLLSFFVVMAVLGFLPAIVLYTVVYVRRVGQVSWGYAILMGAGLGLFSWGLFERFLHLPLPAGWVSRFI